MSAICRAGRSASIRRRDQPRLDVGVAEPTRGPLRIGSRKTTRVMIATRSRERVA